MNRYRLFPAGLFPIHVQDLHVPGTVPPEEREVIGAGTARPPRPTCTSKVELRTSQYWLSACVAAGLSPNINQVLGAMLANGRSPNTHLDDMLGHALIDARNHLQDDWWTR